MEYNAIESSITEENMTTDSWHDLEFPSWSEFELPIPSGFNEMLK
jgi:hypothetical protein